MRSLKDKLDAMNSSRKAPASPPPREREERALYFRETVLPMSQLYGLEKTCLEEVRSCDPYFTGTRWDLNDLLFVDTETTGLNGGAGTIAFEIGLGRMEGDHLRITQYVLSGYDQEEQMLRAVAGCFTENTIVVSFNGKIFDLPLLQSRMILNRIHVTPTAYPHLDLMHVSRRVYRRRLKRCNLSSVEEAALGLVREDDLPGAQVPERFFSYLRTGQFEHIEPVLRHNLQDVLSLAQLTGALCAAFRHPEELEHDEDVLSIGKTLQRTGHSEKARTCYRIVGTRHLRSEGHLYLAMHCKKEKDWAQTVRLCQEMIRRHENGSWPHLQMAMYCEHHLRDARAALRYAETALEIESQRQALGLDRQKEIHSLFARLRRLRRKIMKETERVNTP